MWFVFAILFIVLIPSALFINDTLLFIISGILGVALLIGWGIMQTKKNQLYKKYPDGYDFFASYFSSLFALMEEEIPKTSTISLHANINETCSDQYLKKSVEIKTNMKNVIEKKDMLYEKEICNGTFELKDGAIARFYFTEIIRNRICKKKSASGRKKIKNKYKSTYPFVLSLQLPLSLYELKKDIQLKDLEVKKDEQYYLIKTKRKFDIRAEKSEEYSSYTINSMRLFSVEYFTLEIMNLLNISYGCFTLKKTA